MRRMGEFWEDEQVAAFVKHRREGKDLSDLGEKALEAQRRFVEAFRRHVGQCVVPSRLEDVRAAAADVRDLLRRAKLPLESGGAGTAAQRE